MDHPNEGGGDLYMLFEEDPYTWDLPNKIWRHVWSSITRCKSQLSSLQMNYKKGQGRYSIKCSYNPPMKARVTQVLINRSLGWNVGKRH